MIRNPLERATHPSQEQIEALLEYIEQHPELARGFPKLPAARNRVKKQWEQLAPRLNSIGRSVKTWQQWTKYWADKKSAVKKKAALRAAAAKTGGNPDMVMELSEMEEQILTLITQDYLIDTRPSISLSCDNSATDLEVCNVSGVETHLMDKSEVVLMMSPATLIEEVSSQAQSVLATPSRSPTPSPPPPAPYRATYTPVVTTSSKFRNTVKQRRRERPQGPPTADLNGQRCSQFASLTERFLRVEEQRLELDRRNTSILETVAGIAGQLMERDFERERVFAQALSTVGEGLKLLAEALKKNEPVKYS